MSAEEKRVGGEGVEDSVGGVNTEVDLPTPGTSFMQYAHV